MQWAIIYLHRAVSLNVLLSTADRWAFTEKVFVTHHQVEGEIGVPERNGSLSIKLCFQHTTMSVVSSKF